MSTTDEPPPSSESIQRAQSAIQSLSLILGPLPDPLPSSQNPVLMLLNDPSIASSVSHHLRQPNSGAGDDNLCRWLYDTFQSTDPSLQLAVLRFLPIIAGLYLSRCTARRHHQPLAGFEAVLLALYAHETVARNGNQLTIDIPNLSAPSPYHEAKITSLKSNNKNIAEEPSIATAVLSEALEPHGTVRSTKRARIVGVALELYYSKISNMPIASKVEFCRFASAWAGHYTDSDNEEETNQEEEEEFGEKGERIPLPWELLQPTLRIVGHCMMGQSTAGGGEELKAAAAAAVKALQGRAMHDMNTRAALATRSLVRVGMMDTDTILDPPEMTSVYSDYFESNSAKITA